MSNARDKANIPALNFSSTGIDDNATSTAITITSGENIGIGTASPSQLLHVYSTGNEIARIETNQTEGRLSLKDATGDAILKFRNDYRFTNSSGELVRINSSGNVGINNSAPTVPLEVDGAVKFNEAPGASSGTVIIDGSATGNPQLRYYQNGTAKGYLTYWDSSDTLALTDGSASGLHFSPSTQRVGIGTSSPDQKLHITDSASGSVSSILTIENPNGGSGTGVELRFVPSAYNNNIGSTARWSAIRAINGGSGNPTELTFLTNPASGDPSERMRITAAGNIGIGLTNPDSFHSSGHDLVVGNTTGGHGLTIVASTNDAGNINFADGSSSNASYRGKIIYEHSNDSLAFHSAAAERFRVGSNGNFSIGTTADPARLNVSTASSGLTPHANADDLFVEGSTHSGITIGSGTSSSGNIYFGDSADNSIGRIAYNHSANRMDFMNNGRNSFYMQNYLNISLNTSTYTVIDSIPFGAYLAVIGQASNNTSREVWLLLRIGAAYSVASTRLLQRTATGGGDNRTFDVRGTTGGNLEAKLTAGSSMTNCEITLFKFGM